MNNYVEQAIREIAKTDNPQRFAEMNETAYRIAVVAVEKVMQELPRWRNASRGTTLPGDSIIHPFGDDVRFGRIAIRDSEYITVEELNKLPRENVDAD